MVSEVKRLTDDKVLTAELTLAAVDSADDERHQQRIQVILYDRQININSILAGKRIAFAAVTCESDHCYVITDRQT